MTTSAETVVHQPDWRMLIRHPAHFFALGMGSGLAPKAPGTFGTLAAFPLYWVLTPLMNDYTFLLFLLASYFLGVWMCDKTGREIGVSDHGSIVWDEIVAFMLVLFFTPAGIAWQVLAFVLFRLFDIVKPQPIKYFDQNMHGGSGVMFDDLLAAGYALFVMALIKSMLE